MVHRRNLRMLPDSSVRRRPLEAKLMTIDRDYVVRMKGGLGLDYERYDGTKIRLPWHPAAVR